MQEQPQQPISRRRPMAQDAMRSGTVVGLFFLLQALSFIVPNGVLSSILFMVGFVMVPVMLVWTAIQYRDRQLQGSITYLQSVGYMLWSYLFALIIATLSFYFATRSLFADPQFLSNMQALIEIMRETQPDEGVAEAMEQTLYALTPKTFTTSVVTMALFFGMIYIYIVALFVKRKKQADL